MSDKTRPTKIITTSGRDVGNFPTRLEAEDWLTSLNITPVFREPELAELVVTGKRPLSIWKLGAENFELTFGISPKEVAGFIPYVGDAIDLGDISTDLYKGNYKDAAIGAGLFLLPNIIEKPAKYLYRGVKKAIKSARDYRIGKELNNISLSRSRTKAPVSTTISYTPSNKPAERARLDFFERGPANISEAERAGISKHDRTNIVPYLLGSLSSIPEDILLINRANTPYKFENGKLVWNYLPTGIPGGRRITHHFTLDLPVIGHGGGDWDLVENTMVVPYKHVVERNGLPLNVDIMDTDLFKKGGKLKCRRLKSI